MYTRVAAWATSATPLPMWGVEGSGMVLLPNMVTDFRDKDAPKHRSPTFTLRRKWKSQNRYFERGELEAGYSVEKEAAVYYLRSNLRSPEM